MRISQTHLVNGWTLTLLSLALGAASLCSAATITYNVNLTVGTASVSGDITTDGTIGVINGDNLPSNILNWNLVLTSSSNSTLCSGKPCTFDLIGPNGIVGSFGEQLDINHGVDLSATTTQLLFNFSGTDGGYIFFETGASAAVCFETTTDCLSSAFGAGESLYVGGVFSGDYELTSLSGTQVIGTATGSGSGTPEPSTLVLLGAGIMLLGFRKLGNRHPRCR